MKQITNYKYSLELLLGIFSIIMIPINKHAVVVMMSFWLLVNLINFFSNFRKNSQKLVCGKKLWPFMIFPIFYSIHLIGLIYTTNFDYAFFDLEIKLSMLLIPMAIWLRSTFYSDKQNHFLRAIIYGTLLSFMINILRAGVNYHHTPDLTYFFYTGLSPIHPSYMALYVSFALISILYLGFKKTAFDLKCAQGLGIIIFILLLIYLFLLSSKAGIIVFTVTLFMFIIARYAHKAKTKHLITAIVIVILVPILAICSIPTVKGRFQAMISAVEHARDANLDSQESSMERVAIFITSSKFAYHTLPWGVGTGDTKDEIIENYRKLGSKTINDRYLNAHNQYLQTTITLGILGLASLFLILVGGFRYAIKKRNVLFFSFLILIGLNMLFESMLEQQAGVIFITLFFTLFCIWEKPKLNNH